MAVRGEDWREGPGRGLSQANAAYRSSLIPLPLTPPDSRSLAAPPPGGVGRPAGPVVAAALSRGLDDPDLPVRRACLAGLGLAAGGGFHPEAAAAAAAVRRRMKREAGEMRVRAAEVLGDLVDPDKVGSVR